MKGRGKTVTIHAYVLFFIMFINIFDLKKHAIFQYELPNHLSSHPPPPLEKT